MRRALVALAFGSLLIPSLASADDTGVWKAFKGKILISEAPFASSHDSDGAMIAAFKRQSRTEIVGNGESWVINLMVFLKAPSGDTSIHVVFYDVTNPKKREVANHTEITVQPSQKTVKLDGITLLKENTFAKGKKYEVLATRLVNGKEDVYAKATLRLR